MKRTILVCLVATVASGCANRPFDAAAERAALLQRDADWSTVASEGKDVEKTIAYWSDDAVIIPQGQPVVEGKAAIRTFVTESFKIPGFKIHWVSSNITFSPDGQLAYMRGANEMTVPGPDGKLLTLPGRGITIWRHDPDGQWRCVVDTWNDPPPPAVASAPK